MILNPLDFSGRKVLVTGAASGIGLATCKLLSELGASVVAVDCSETGLANTLNSLSGTGHTSHCFDLRDVSEIPGALVEWAQSDGKLHGLVHAAGSSLVSPTRLFSLESYHDVMAVNTEAALALLCGFQNRKVCLKEGGSVVFISSVMGLVGSAGASVYAMSKAALIGLTKSSALEFAPRGIRVNCVAPGFVKTQMYERMALMWNDDQRRQVELAHPLGLGEASDIAHSVVFLLADTSRWITGTVLVCDGGYTAS